MGSPPSSLFAQPKEPLAARLRPRTLDEFVGQEHIVGPQRLLRRAIAADQLSSIILSGPPGTGKTTLARVIAERTRGQFLSLNAVLSGVKEVRESIASATSFWQQYGRKTILFVDEVHRWNKSQQDALLPWVENGTIILIGATTENPFFEVNRALLSRSRVFILRALTDDDLSRVLETALTDRERGYGAISVQIDPAAKSHLLRCAAGDARTLLNALELAVETSPTRFPPPREETIKITLEIAEDSIQQRAVLYDKDGDHHFDTISAFIKAVRGSDPDAALYWLARMVHAGEDPRFVFRRLLISAAEDIGLADPQGIVVVQSCAQAFDRVGMPEGQYHLAQATLYLANALKSNSNLAFFDALKEVERAGTADVPLHLRDASRDGDDFGHGRDYRYPHAYHEHWVAQRYLPDDLQGAVYYQPGELGWEGELRPRLAARRELQAAAAAEARAELLTARGRHVGAEGHFLTRIEDQRGANVVLLREKIMAIANLAPHHRVLLVDPHPRLLFGPLVQLVREGYVAVVGADSDEQEWLESVSRNMAAVERPTIEKATVEAWFMATDQSAGALNAVAFERILLRLPTAVPDAHRYQTRLRAACDTGGLVVCFGPDWSEHSTLSALLLPSEPELAGALHAAEQAATLGLTATRQQLLPTAHWQKLSDEIVAIQELRRVERREIGQWLRPGSPLAAHLAASERESIEEALNRLIDRRGSERCEWIRLHRVSVHQRKADPPQA